MRSFTKYSSQAELQGEGKAFCLTAQAQAGCRQSMIFKHAGIIAVAPFEKQADKPVTQPVEHPLDIIMPGISLIKRTLSTSRTTCLIDRYSSRHGMMTVSSAFILSLLVTFLFVPYPHPDVLDR